MVDLTLPYEFVGGTKAIANQVNANFEAVTNGFAGFNIELEQLKSEVTKFNSKPLRDSFDIIPSLLGKAPAGAYPLWTGEWIYNARTLFKEFWTRALEYKKAGTIRTLSTEEYDKEVGDYFETGAFVIDELNGHIRLPKITKFIKSLEDLAELGVPKLDQMQGHGHRGSITNAFGSGAAHWNCNSNPSTGTKIMTDIVEDGENGEPRIGKETYPSHISIALYIQVANNTADISKLDTNIIAEQLNNAIAEIEAKYAAQKSEFDALNDKTIEALNNKSMEIMDFVIDESNKQIAVIGAEGTKQVGLVIDEGNRQVQRVIDTGSGIEQSGKEQVGLVTAEGVKQIGLVTQSGSDLVTTGTAQANLVTAEGNKQVKRVQDIGVNLQELGDTQVGRVQTVVAEEVDKKLPEITGKVNEIIGAGNAQIQRVTTEGTSQISLATKQADRAKGEADKAAKSALEAAESAKNVNQRSETIYTSQKDLGSVSGNVTVSLEAGYFEYVVTAAGNINFTFDFTNVDLSKIITFALNIKQSDNHTYSYNFGEGTNFTWLDEIAATPRGSYLLTFRRYPDGNIVGTPIGQMS